jgi:hypothetical protein
VQLRVKTKSQVTVDGFRPHRPAPPLRALTAVTTAEAAAAAAVVGQRGAGPSWNESPRTPPNQRVQRRTPLKAQLMGVRVCAVALATDSSVAPRRGCCASSVGADIGQQQGTVAVASPQKAPFSRRAPPPQGPSPYSPCRPTGYGIGKSKGR